MNKIRSSFVYIKRKLKNQYIFLDFFCDLLIERKKVRRRGFCHFSFEKKFNRIEFNKNDKTGHIILFFFSLDFLFFNNY